ncbi:MAG: 2-C-methyl-D-erythritol 4-phosphate cytidylyltransferase, partial [Actinomycetota bacterium]|nr:2-C-methyl-D-erythritol 4-phosphate cytidylyltransferase [Actinomycetota bacterium]
WWHVVRRSPPRRLMVHDALCPLAPVDFLTDLCESRVAAAGASVAAFRPVTDTVKTALDGRIRGTIDRDFLVALTSPVVIAETVVAAAMTAGDLPPTDDFGALVAWLRTRGAVELVHAPAIARRVEDVSAVNLLECVDELAHQVRTGGGRGGPAAPLSAAPDSRTP